MKYIRDITEFIFVEHQPAKADIIFIPGGSYCEPAERAAKLYGEGYAPLVMPSGKFSVKHGSFPGPKTNADLYHRKYATEWEFLRDVLMQNGVPESAILRENQATYTYENAMYSKQMADVHQLAIKTAILCCKSFHARRCLMYYQTFFPKVEFLICPAQMPAIERDGWMKTNPGIEKVLSELSKCGNQFVDIMKGL